ncbi:magnesium-protoporphyrin IX monomethyl ester (oxidative) cyclase [Anabaena cylindrica FACHB-243]|uniref:Magnesium-protoporphyrin IX monomethyl ester [oxidative] cyclase n=1 Tax=Anabaena cylindrica (strain ATCC 27899 / PCC 7122) TaxID=272123 RepID=K9ZJY1_ANACC|nr:MULTISPECIES: magnesium-protoporphyrin IX monomethyl ester (oxidative) cyclase [Anabaena]AFZ58847.1 Mg-protoporphyrin IX monomethyl ester (oxidative) cyclase [Anabaena cylindrica PCC 7122]MBD2421527.1 magnesium-protoporphyrin IX monomethyl ester (oxidative) cyclase [Anabaena cylindrica FACHB-243]MBY5282830.1 magnesium-protoporphyrin IX monomethyl ester (oxidative) cyclase [Anabaena sp. CCAP 1446/1C]MBY5311399.1 magnesium-protoporphyrin IX monomethyl ester (oxidative) cyclase [Anabaena sp. CC
MVNTLPQPEVKPGIKAPAKETVLTPRFYTTDFEAAASLDLSAQEKELQAMLAEMRADYNRHHFVRDEEFEQSWEHIDGEARRAFIEYLERSCISEFSGFLLFKELSRKLKQRSPLLAEIFQLMARDEARHAGFLNKAMGDFKLSLDLGEVTKVRTYTFFPLEWVLYTVYLSEKIGYWRYIIIYHHLQKHSEHQFYPIFRKFESWCQDENRHGDIFKALLRSQPQLWNNWRSRLWSRFFLLSVFATHTLTVHERASFYHLLGLEPTEFDQQVVRNTNETAGRAFPVMLNTEHPHFFPRLQNCSNYNLKIAEISRSSSNKVVKFIRKLPLITAILWNLLLVYLIKPIDTEVLRGTVR